MTTIIEGDVNVNKYEGILAALFGPDPEQDGSQIFRASGIQVMSYQEKVHRSTKLDSALSTEVDGLGSQSSVDTRLYAQCVIPGSYLDRRSHDGPRRERVSRRLALAVEKGFIPIRRKSERELFIKFENGSFIECRSEENPDQLIGEGLDLVVLAEAARLKQRTWDQYIRPALADRQGRALFSSTPRGFNWFHDFYQKGQDPTNPDNAWWESWSVPSRMNPILPAEKSRKPRRPQLLNHSPKNGKLSSSRTVASSSPSSTLTFTFESLILQLRATHTDLVLTQVRQLHMQCSPGPDHT
jgi:hypothetical protein